MFDIAMEHRIRPLRWRNGYSARTQAYSWQEAEGFPDEVRVVLSQEFAAPELLPDHL